MNKYLKAITILMVLLLCLSFTVGAAQSGETKIKTKEELVQDKIKAKDFVKHQQPHDKSTFDREVAGTLGLKVKSAKNKVPDGFEVPEDGYQTMVSYKTNGKIFIRDTVHKVETIQIPWNEITSLPGFNGEIVLLKHYNDYGIQDAVWVQYVYNDNGYAYLEELHFSEIIVSGFVGTYTKADSNLNFSDTINLGYTFDSDDVNYINLTIEDQYSTKTNPYDINTTGLVGWWKFDEGSGTNVSDSSGNGNHGTFAAANYTNGKYNSGGLFDGVDDYVTISSFAHNDESMTLSFWINTNETGSNTYAVRTSTDSFGIRVLKSSIFFNVLDADADSIHIFYNQSTEGVFFVSGVYDYNSQKMELYLNGILLPIAPSESIDAPLATNSSDLYFGFEGTGDRYFDGIIDNIMIYNHSRSQEEIGNLYNLKTEQLKVKTNSNETYSDYWNSSADNPLSIPYGAGESITSLTFNDTAPIVQNGITIYEPSNMLFNTSIEVGHLENTTNIYEEVNGDSYQIFIQHIPGVNSTSGTISFTSDANDILSSPYLTTGMDTSNTNAVMSYNAATREWTVTTGAITAGTTYNYVLFGILEGEALENIAEGGFGSDNMHAYTATANDTIIIGSAFRATYGDSVWGNQSNDLWSDLGPLFILASVILVVGVIVVSVRRFRE